MSYKDGTKSGGKVKGSKNKSTLARIAAVEQACKIIANTNGTGVFDGDAQALLQIIYKTEAFPIDLRMRAAESANTRERPALQSVDSTVTGGDTYIVRMPQMPKDLAEWTSLYGEQYPADPAEDAEWKSKLEQAAIAAKAKKDQVQ